MYASARILSSSSAMKKDSSSTIVFSSIELRIPSIVCVLYRASGVVYLKFSFAVGQSSRRCLAIREPVREACWLSMVKMIDSWANDSSQSLFKGFKITESSL